ncbi:MAG: hypothetical protein ACTHM8_00675 [Sphingomonas sp.]
MHDRTAALLLGFLALLAFILFVLWDTDAVLKAKCHHAGGTWQAGARICAISADRVPGSPASPDR